MANVFKAVIRTFVDVRYCEDKCCCVLFWSSIEIVMQVVGAERRVQLSLVVSYSDANASSPGFTVTGSIFIGRQGWYLKTSAGTSDHE